jgi:glycerol uptake facilitator-like aquaporin
MFELPLFELAVKARTGPAQWFAEFVATFGLIVTILAVSRFKSEAIPVAVGLYITAAYWFTASILRLFLDLSAGNVEPALARGGGGGRSLR